MTKQRQLPDPNVPNRKRNWLAFCNFIIAELSPCDEDNRGRVVQRADKQSKVLRIDVTCTHEVFKQCILPVLNAYEGYALGYKPHDDRRRLGAEYDYPLIFTPESSEAQWFYIVDGMLYYYRPDDADDDDQSDDFGDDSRRRGWNK